MTASDQPSIAAGQEQQDLDPAALARLKRFGGSKLLVEMIALYLGAAPERIAVASTAESAGDVAAAESALHSLKSSSAQLGAMRMSRLCERGELIARAGTLSGVREIIDAMEAELPRVREWLVGARNEAGT